LRSQQQENELTTLIDTYEPHIIHARETHLDKTISIAEIIDTNIYEVCRKDRYLADYLRNMMGIPVTN
jgi:hypothetical protein